MCCCNGRRISKRVVAVPLSLNDSLVVEFDNNCNCSVEHYRVVKRVRSVSVVTHDALDRRAQRLSCSRDSIAVEIRVDSSLVVNLDKKLVAAVSDVVASRILGSHCNRVSCERENV